MTVKFIDKTEQSGLKTLTFDELNTDNIYKRVGGTEIIKKGRFNHKDGSTISVAILLNKNAYQVDVYVPDNTTLYTLYAKNLEHVVS